MEVFAGHDHISEMTLSQLIGVCSEAPFELEHLEPMSVMSGSEWFDQHPVLLSGLLLVEALHEKLRRPSWAHSVMLRLRRI